MLIFLGDNIPVVYSIDISKATAWEHGSGVLLHMGKLNKGNWTLTYHNSIICQLRIDISKQQLFKGYTNLTRSKYQKLNISI